MKNMLQEDLNAIIKNCDNYVQKIISSSNHAELNDIAEFISTQSIIMNNIEKNIQLIAFNPTIRKEYNLELPTDKYNNDDINVEDVNVDTNNSYDEPNCTTSTEYANTHNDLDDKFDNMTVEDIFREELEAWGIKETSFAYEVFIYIANYAKPDMEYDDILNTIANVTGKRKCSISSAISNVTRHADFSKSKYIPILTKLPRVKITKEYLIKQLIEFCE